MRRKKYIDVGGISERNPKVDTERLRESFQVMQNLIACGVTFGPNYNLGSPYSSPRPVQDKGTRPRSAIRLSEHK
jgi:hypothetical protein